MTTYVLVPGAWLGGWVWDEVAADLRGRGHEVHPVTLTGVGDRSHLAGHHVDLETHITDVVRTLEDRDLVDVVLVGHSYAGVVVSGVADRAGSRLAQLVFVDSGPFEDGMAFLDFFPPEAQAALRAQVGDGWGLPMPPPEVLGQQASLAGLRPADLELMARRATPHPFGSYTQPLRIEGHAGTPPYGQALVACTDGGFTIAQVREMIAAGAPSFALMSGPGWRFEELPTGHWPMRSAPTAAAEVLERLGGAVRP